MNKSPKSGNVAIVRTLHTGMLTLLALTWVLLTSHCQLEALPGFEFLRCTAEASSSHEDDPCSTGGCCTLESAQYQLPRQQDIDPLVVIVILPTAPRGLVEPALPKDVRLGLLTAAPPEQLQSWRFVARAALPPRAPSFAS